MPRQPVRANTRDRLQYALGAILSQNKANYNEVLAAERNPGHVPPFWGNLSPKQQMDAVEAARIILRTPIQDGQVVKLIQTDIPLYLDDLSSDSNAGNQDGRDLALSVCKIFTPQEQYPALVKEIEDKFYPSVALEMITGSVIAGGQNLTSADKRAIAEALNEYPGGIKELYKQWKINPALLGYNYPNAQTLIAAVKAPNSPLRQAQDLVYYNFLQQAGLSAGGIFGPNSSNELTAIINRSWHDISTLDSNKRTRLATTIKEVAIDLNRQADKYNVNPDFSCITSLINAYTLPKTPQPVISKSADELKRRDPNAMSRGTAKALVNIGGPVVLVAVAAVAFFINPWLGLGVLLWGAAGLYLGHRLGWRENIIGDLSYNPKKEEKGIDQIQKKRDLYKNIFEQYHRFNHGSLDEAKYRKNIETYINKAGKSGLLDPILAGTNGYNFHQIDKQIHTQPLAPKYDRYNINAIDAQLTEGLQFKVAPSGDVLVELDSASYSRSAVMLGFLQRAIPTLPTLTNRGTFLINVGQDYQAWQQYVQPALDQYQMANFDTCLVTQNGTIAQVTVPGQPLPVQGNLFVQPEGSPMAYAYTLNAQGQLDPAAPQEVPVPMQALQQFSQQQDAAIQQAYAQQFAQAIAGQGNAPDAQAQQEGAQQAAEAMRQNNIHYFEPLPFLHRPVNAGGVNPQQTPNQHQHQHGHHHHHPH